MPRIISFGWTTPALLAGAKTCTRRNWNDRYARSFRPGEVCTAYDRNPRVHGKPVARIQIESVSPERVPMIKAPPSDYAKEGFLWFDQHPEEREKALPKLMAGLSLQRYRAITMAELFESWVTSGQSLYVVRFKLLEVSARSEAASSG